MEVYSWENQLEMGHLYHGYVKRQGSTGMIQCQGLTLAMPS